MTDIPDWAGKRACELLNADFTGGTGCYLWPEHASINQVTTVAKLVMQHEQPPADPDEEAARRILAAFYGADVFSRTGPDVDRAVSQYKQEKANG